MKKALADKLVKQKGSREGTKDWLRMQLASKSANEEEETDEPEQGANKLRRRLLDKLRSRGQGEHVPGNSLNSL